jgi:hypothetical protein
VATGAASVEVDGAEDVATEEASVVATGTYVVAGAGA